MCASLHTPDGRVNIPGFYDDVRDVEPWEREELRKLGTSEADYREFLGIPAFHAPPGYTPFEAVRFLPTLEFNGIGGGYQGEGSKTVIPSKAFVKISCRLVPNQTPEKIRPLLYAAIRERMPRDVTLPHHRPARGHALRRRAAGPLQHAGGPAARARPGVSGRWTRRSTGSSAGLRSTCARAAACRSSPTSSACSGSTRCMLGPVPARRTTSTRPTRASTCASCKRASAVSEQMLAALAGAERA